MILRGLWRYNLCSLTAKKASITGKTHNLDVFRRFGVPHLLLHYKFTNCSDLCPNHRPRKRSLTGREAWTSMVKLGAICQVQAHFVSAYCTQMQPHVMLFWSLKLQHSRQNAKTGAHSWNSYKNEGIFCVHFWNRSTTGWLAFKKRFKLLPKTMKTFACWHDVGWFVKQVDVPKGVHLAPEFRSSSRNRAKFWELIFLNLNCWIYCVSIMHLSFRCLSTRLFVHVFDCKLEETWCITTIENQCFWASFCDLKIAATHGD